MTFLDSVVASGHDNLVGSARDADDNFKYLIDNKATADAIIQRKAALAIHVITALGSQNFQLQQGNVRVGFPKS